MRGGVVQIESHWGESTSPASAGSEHVNKRYHKDIWASRVDSPFQIVLHLIGDTISEEVCVREAALSARSLMSPR